MRHLFWIILLLSNFSLISAYNTSEYAPISINNAANLQEIQVLGDGSMRDVVAWSASGQIVVAGIRGLYIYEDLQADAGFIELGINVQSLLFAGETLFFSDGTSLYAYDLANQQILYSLEGQRPLAVSNNGMMLAYEVDMGVRVLEISTGTVLHDLSYEGILEEEYYYEEEGSSLENSFVFVRFFPNDGGVLVRWVRQYSDERWEGGYLAGNDIWILNETSQPSPIDYEFMSYIWDFVATDANGNFFAVDEMSIHNANTSFSLDLQAGEYLSPEFQDTRYTVKNNLFAAAVVYSNDNDWQRSTKIWDVTTGELLANLPASGHISFSPDASKVAIGRHIFELATGEELAFLQMETYRLLRGLPDRIFQYGADDSIRLLDANSLEEIAVLPLRMSELQDYPYMANADGSFLIQQKDSPLIFRIDGHTGAELARFYDDTPSEYHTSLAFSPDSQYLLSPHYVNDEVLVTLWDANTGEEIALPENYQPIQPYFYTDGSLIVVDTDSANADVLFYNIVSASVSKRFPRPSQQEWDRLFIGLTFSPDSRFVFMKNRINSQIWSIADETVVLQIPSLVWDWVFNASSSFFAYETEGDEIHVVNLLSGSITLETTVNGYLRFATDRLLVVTDPNDYSNKHYFDVVTGEEVFDPIIEERPMYEANSLRFFSDGMSIRVESNQNLVLAMLDTGSVSSMSMSSDGKLIIISYYDGRLGIWAVVE